MIDIQTYNENKDRWYKEYIDQVDIKNLKWQKLNALELKKFYAENYYDYIVGCYVSGSRSTKSYATPFGLKYMPIYYINDKSNFLISHSLNNKKTNTIVTCLSFVEDCKDRFTDNTYTFIEFVEVNEYFQGNKLLNEMAAELPKYIDLNHDIIITSESTKGSVCKVHEHLYLALKKRGFNNKFESNC